MSILIENEHDYQLDFDYQKVAEDVIEATLTMEHCPYEAQVNITLVDDESIADINREFRGIDKATDVLSFPMIEFTKPAEYDIILGGNASYFELDSEELLLGDIIISIPTAIRQAREYGHDMTREYAFLIAHSVLHLLGYDHIDEQEANDMEKKQETILKKLGITRDGIK